MRGLISPDWRLLLATRCGGLTVADYINLVKLCVGAEKVEDQILWQQKRRAAGHPSRHVTRMWPKRGEDLLNGGSLYWVFKGVILARQKVIGLNEVRGEDGILRCGIMLDEAVIRTEGAPRRPFQGWRYLNPADSPRDLPKNRVAEDALPPALNAALAEIGVR